MPTHKWIIPGDEIRFRCPNGFGPGRTMLKLQAKGLTLAEFNKLTGLNIPTRHRAKAITGYLPPFRKKQKGLLEKIIEELKGEI